MKILKARLYELEKTRQDNSIANDRKSQVGSGERSEKIRTYNFPQNRVTDHRITGRNFNVEVILDGNLEDMIQTLTDWFAKKTLEERLQEIIA
jgi:peptide chain release factor 1